MVFSTVFCVVLCAQWKWVKQFVAVFLKTVSFRLAI